MMADVTKADSLYKRTAEKIYSSLVINKANPGEKLLPIKILCKNYDISYLTAQRAISYLQKEGILISKRGSGTYLTEKILDEAKNKRIQMIAGSSPQTPVTEIMESMERKSRSIGIIFPYWMKEHGEFAYHKIVRGFLNSIDTLNWRVEMINNFSHQASHPDFVDKIIEKRIDGILWLSPQIEHKMNIMRLIDHNLYVVGVGRAFPELPFKSIFADFDELAKKIVKKYWKSGKKVVLLIGPTEGLLRDENSCTFAEKMKEALRLENFELPDENIGATAIFTPGCKELEKLTIDFLSHHADADIIVCYHEEFLSAIEKLDNQNFWKSPRPTILSINADFGLRIEKAGTIPVNLINLPLESLGTVAARNFKEKWTSEPLEPFDIKVLSPEL